MFVLCFPSSQNYKKVKSFSAYSYTLESASLPFFTRGITLAIHKTAPGLKRGAPCLSSAHRLPGCSSPNTWTTYPSSAETSGVLVEVCTSCWLAGWPCQIKANNPNLWINHISLHSSISRCCSGTNNLTSCLRTQDEKRRKDILLKDEGVSMAMTSEPV